MLQRRLHSVEQTLSSAKKDMVRTAEHAAKEVAPKAKAVGQFVQGVSNSIEENISLGAISPSPENTPNSKAYEAGKVIGDVASLALGVYEGVQGAETMAAGIALAGGVTIGSDGVAAAVAISAGVAVASVGLAGATHGAATTWTSASNTAKDTMQLFESGGTEGTRDVSSLGKLSANELKSIGSPAENSGIRRVSGNSSDALKFFKNQVNPSTIREAKPGVYVGNDGEGITFTYRATSQSGPPTIDVNGVRGLRKIKFTN